MLANAKQIADMVVGMKLGLPGHDLGNDIGQRRLQFNARLYEVMPSYRDDNSCLWLADQQRADTQHEVNTTPPLAPPRPPCSATATPSGPAWCRSTGATGAACSTPR